MTSRERERRRRAKHRAQKLRRRENVVRDVERRLSAKDDGPSRDGLVAHYAAEDIDITQRVFNQWKSRI